MEPTEPGGGPATACVISVERPDLVRHALAKALGRDVLDHQFTTEEADAMKDLANLIGDCAA